VAWFVGLAIACGQDAAPIDTTTTSEATGEPVPMPMVTSSDGSSVGSIDPPDPTTDEPTSASASAIDSTDTGEVTTDTGEAESSGTGEDVPPIVEPSFVEIAAAAGIDHVHGILSSPPSCLVDSIGPSGPGSNCTPEREVAAAAVADYDLDGWDDLLVTRTHGRPLLYRNDGDGTFTEVGGAEGLTIPFATSGAAWADVDNDGDPDLYIATIGQPRYYFYLNVNGHFVESAVERGLALASDYQHTGTSIAPGDYDLDGFIDLYVAEWRTVAGMGEIASHARLLHNRGTAEPGYFDDVTETAGVSLDAVWSQTGTAAGVYGFSPAFADLDGDRFADLVVVSDFGCSRLFWNQGDGTFVDGTSQSNVGYDEYGMGSTFGDFDLDGDLDWFVTSITRPDQPPGNKLYRYDGFGIFHDVAVAQGVGSGGWGWGATFFDPDNDGDLELMMTGGWYHTTHLEEPHLLWKNEDGTYTEEIAEAAGIADISQGRGIAVFDYDRDGDEDVYVANNFEPGALYRNETGNEHDWLRVRPVGTTSNADALGAIVTVFVTPNDPPRVHHIGSRSHYMGQSERIAHIGLGYGNTPVAEVRVYWPKTDLWQIFNDIPRNTELVVVE
jgi:hypothetical protein